jgi:hypothetical protein
MLTLSSDKHDVEASATKVIRHYNFNVPLESHVLARARARWFVEDHDKNSIRHIWNAVSNKLGRKPHGYRSGDKPVAVWGFTFEGKPVIMRIGLTGMEVRVSWDMPTTASLQLASDLGQMLFGDQDD